MPAALPLVAMVAAAAIELSPIAAALLVTGASLVSGALQRSMAKSPQAGGTIERGGFKLPSRSTQEVHRVIYGTYKVAGNEVFLEATGADNKTLWMVQNFAEGEIEGIVSGKDGVPQIFLDDRLYNTYGGNVQCWFHRGSPVQTVDTTLAAAVPKWTDNKRSAAYAVFKLTYDRNYFAGKPLITLLLKGRILHDIRTTFVAGGTCTVSGNTASKPTGSNAWSSSVRSLESHTGGAALLFSPNQVNKNIIIGLNSDPLIDQSYTSLDYGWYLGANGTTAIFESSVNVGGGGNYTPDTVFAIVYDGATVTYLMDGVVKRTVAVAAGLEYFFDSSFYTVGVAVRNLQFGAAPATNDNLVNAAYDWFTNTRYGLGVNPAMIDLPSWISAANYCDLKGWKINMVIADRAKSFDTLEDILRHFRGEIIWSGGKYALRYADLNYESVAKVIGDADIIQDSSGKAAITVAQPSMYGKADGLLVKMVDAAKGYSVDDIPIGNEQGVVNEYSLLGATSKAHVLEIGNYALERQLLDRTISGQFRDDCGYLEPHDLVDFSCSSRSIANQLLRVQQKDRQDDGTVALVFSYEDLALYNRVIDLDVEDVYSCTLPDRSSLPPEVENIQLVEENYNFRLRTFTRLKASYTIPPAYPWFDRVEVWVSLNGGETYTHQFDSTSNGFTLDPVEEGTTYYLRLITVSIDKKRTDPSVAPVVSRTIQGRNDAPASLGSLEVIVGENSSVRAYSARVDDADVDLYEFRLGLSWSSGVFLGALNAPNLPLPGVKPGVFTLFANTKSSNGQYGDTPRSASVTLAEPPDHWAVQSTTANNYTTGTFTNTQMVLYGGENYLKCSHTGGVLTGSYKSTVIDRGASGRYLAYILADLVVTGEGQRWADVVPSGATWATMGITRKWREIFQPLAAPTVRLKLWYGDTNPPANVVERLEILSAIVQGRYFQVEIEIIDPSPTVNALVEHFTLKLCQ